MGLALTQEALSAVRPSQSAVSKPLACTPRLREWSRPTSAHRGAVVSPSLSIPEKGGMDRALPAWLPAPGILPSPCLGVQALGVPNQQEGLSQAAVGSTSLRHQGAHVPLRVGRPGAGRERPAEVSTRERDKKVTELAAVSSPLVSSPRWPRGLKAWVPELHGLTAVLSPGVRPSIRDVRG